ncbi:hypothetical protein ARMGADRAFT_1067864 [Armillaria gallica]|uniref:Uncharacterized protein n=1 Tax=Armillaria gallica TaxID=47427 RepID=A0A2H3CJJ7_ARMGA|nr:hypothetical protein ARMGADRAFT_1067864 [Armillaria gallica]
MVDSSEGNPLRGTYFRMTTNARGSGVFHDLDEDAREEEYGIDRGPDTGLRTKNSNDKDDNGDQAGNTLEIPSGKLKLLPTRITFNLTGSSLSAKNRDYEVWASRWPGAAVRSSSIDDNEAAKSEGETVGALIELRRVTPSSFLFIN